MISTQPNKHIGHPTHKSRGYITLKVQGHVYRQTHVYIYIQIHPRTHTHARTHAYTHTYKYITTDELSKCNQYT